MQIQPPMNDVKVIFAHFNCCDLDTWIKRNSKFIKWTNPNARRVTTKVDGLSLLKDILYKMMPVTVGQIDPLRQKAKEIKLLTFGYDVNSMVIIELVSRSKVKSLNSEGLSMIALVYVSWPF
jgi:hypothetical protein